MIQAVIFDMDGLLVDSEPFWREAEQQVFGKLGVPLTEAMTHQTTGLRTDEVVAYWHRQFPWTGRSLPEVTADLNAAALHLIAANAAPLPGVADVLAFFSAKRLPLAVASSSTMELIEAVLEKLDIRPFFKLVHSGTLEAKGKPDPAVYLTTARLLGLSPAQCLAFEDSVNGMNAGLKAGMKVITVPAAESRHLPAFDVATLKLNSLTEFDEEKWLRLSGKS
jgi:sugar-phosphatase